MNIEHPPTPAGAANTGGPANTAESANHTNPTSPVNSAAQASPVAHASAASQSGEAERPRPRTSPIVWGAIVLAFCVYSAAQLFAPGTIDGTTFLITSVIGLGVLLLAVGVVVIMRSQSNSRR